MVIKHRRLMSSGLRRTLAVTALAAVIVGGVKVTGDYTTPGSGFSTIATGAADPTGPTGGPSGPGGMNGSQFQPPGLPPQMPDYQGGINQPPLDQNGGVSIYNTGSPGAQQVPSQQGAQQPQQAQQPAHGSQIPDYQSNPGYTQGPGQPNPDYQAPQQNSPQQPQQPQQGQQPEQQQPNQQQPQNKQDDTTQQLDQQQRQQQCMSAAQYYGIAQQMLSFMASAAGGAGSLFQQPSRKFGPGGDCNCAPEQAGPFKEAPGDDGNQPPPQPEKNTYYDDGKGKTEIRTCLLNPVDCSRSQSSPQKAVDESKKAFPESQNEFDNRLDAARHCIWQGLMTEMANQDFAKRMGYAHEIDSPSPTPGPRKMDEHNNDIGQAIGLQNEGNQQAIIDQCITKATSAAIVPDMDTIADLSAYAGQLVAMRPN